MLQQVVDAASLKGFGGVAVVKGLGDGYVAICINVSGRLSDEYRSWDEWKTPEAALLDLGAKLGVEVRERQPTEGEIRHALDYGRTVDQHLR